MREPRTMADDERTKTMMMELPSNHNARSSKSTMASTRRTCIRRMKPEITAARKRTTPAMTTMSVSVLFSAVLVLLLPNKVSGLDEDYLWNVTDGDPATTILFPWVVQCIGVVCFFVLTRFEIPLPYAAVMFVCGIAMGVGAVWTARGAQETQQVNKLCQSIVQWSNINSSVLLLVFLPGLIFRDAIEVNFQMFRASLPQILIFAFPMVLVGTGMTAAVGYYVIPYNWPLSLAATLGSILASTDPVAVGSVLKTAGAPPRLQLLISGESMLNDGSAVVFYTIFSQQYFASLGYADSVSVAEGFALFFRMSLGGIAVGIAFAAGLLLMLHELDRRLEPEFDVCQVVAALTFAYLSYYVSEQVCAMSGVIACVVCGITARALGRGLINDPQLMDSYLSLMEYLLNTLLFALGGVVWGKVIAHGSIAVKVINWDDWLYLLALYALVMGIRFVQVGLFYPLYSRIGLGSDWKEAVFFAYGGLRGAVGIALALSLNRSVREVTDNPDTLSAAQSLEFLAGGVTLLTLLINASTAGPVLKALGLAKPVMSRKRALQLFQASAESFVYMEYQKLLMEERFQKTSFQVVQAHVPFVTREPGHNSVSNNDNDGGSMMETIEEDCSAISSLASPEPSGARARRHRRLTSLDTVDVGYVTGIRTISERACPQEILMEMREMFMELLNEGYTSEIKNGELDEKEYGGTNIELLQQSVKVGISDVCHRERIHDWEWLNDNAPINNARKGREFEVLDNARTSFLNIFHHLRVADDNDDMQSQCHTFDYQQKRIAILRAIAFIEAHRLAEKKLLGYVDYVSSGDSRLPLQREDSGDTEDAQHFDNAIDIVLAESAEQVLEASIFLSTFSVHEVQNIRSHKVCGILLHRLAAFIEKSANDGLITKKEANVYLARIDRNAKESHTCDKEYPLSSSPPTLSSPNESDDDDKTAFACNKDIDIDQSMSTTIPIPGQVSRVFDPVDINVA